jgi:hypothetical protein
VVTSPPPRPAAPPPTFRADIRPILQAKCVTCHGTSDKLKGGLDVRTVAAILKGGESGPALVRGEPERSPLWEAVATDQMPPGKVKLTPAEKEKLRRWIAGGAP